MVYKWTKYCIDNEIHINKTFKLRQVLSEDV